MSSQFQRNLTIGIFWSIFGRIGYLLVALATNIILVRFLTPYEFGQVGIVIFFISIAQVLIDTGLSGALIRKKEILEIDYSTVFLFNLGVSLILMLLLIGFAGQIAQYYDDLSLKNILVVSSSLLLINAFRLTQTAKLIHQLEFRKKASYEFASVLVASIIAIIMAWQDFGGWAVIALQGLTAFLLTAIMWFFEGAIKSFRFSKTSFLSLYKFGINTTFASLLITAFDNIYQLILAKYFAISQTGLFYQSKKIQDVPLGLISMLANGVLFSSLAKIQDDRKKFNLLYNRITTAFSALMGFACAAIVLYAEQIINLLYGNQWIDASFYLQILIVVAFFYMHEILTQTIFKTFDKTQKILYLELVKKIIQTISIIIGVVLLNLKILLLGFLITYVFSYTINMIYARREINASVLEELARTIKIVLTASIAMIFTELVLDYFSVQGYYSFLALPMLFLIYFMFLRVTKVFSLIEDIKAIKQVITEKK